MSLTDPRGVLRRLRGEARAGQDELVDVLDVGDAAQDVPAETAEPGSLASARWGLANVGVTETSDSESLTHATRA